MSLMIMAACLLLAPVLAIAQAPDLKPRVLLPGEGCGSFWLGAPNIAIVTVRNAEWLGSPVSITPELLTVKLVAVDAEIEYVIKGSLSKGATRFYFFANVVIPNKGYTTIRSWFQPGHRYVVFLREDGSVLRTMADFTEPNIRIRTGYRETLPGIESGSRLDAGVAIASAALTPSANYEEGFASEIEGTSGRLLLVTSPRVIAALLRNLLSYDDVEIRERACLALSIHYSYRDPCLERLTQSRHPEIRQQTNLWIPGKRVAGPRLLKALKEDPTSLSISGRVEDLAGDLELFTFDSDEAVRKQACQALNRLFPQREFPACADAVRNSVQPIRR